MTQSNEIFFKVAKLISEQLSIDETQLKFETTFLDLNIDELDHIEIIMKTEEMFRIEISDKEMESINSIDSLISCVNKLLEKNSKPV